MPYDDDIPTEEIPKILLILIGIIYASGFLISYFFLSKFGLHSPAPLFKLKYIHIGFMHLTLLLIFIVPPLVFLYITKKRSDLCWQSMLILVFIVFLWLTIWYIFAFFAPHGELSKHNWLVFLNFIPLVLILIIRFYDSFSTDEPNRNLFLRRYNELYLRLIILAYLLIIIYFDYQSFHILFTKLNEMIWYKRFKGINFIAIAFTISLLSWVTYYSITKYSSKEIKKAIFCVSFIFLIILYYFSILTFAIFIYPYIPAEKGGGDYFFSRDIIINTVNNKIKLPDIFSDTHCYRLKIIDSSDDYIYIAKESDCNGSIEWKKLDKDKLPRIIGLNKEDINLIYLKY
jgi:hypothetical protein